MRDETIWSKTTKGADEVVHRINRLPQRLRTALILTDGRTPWRELRVRLEALGDAQQIIRVLHSEGYIAAESDAIVVSAATPAVGPPPSTPPPSRPLEQRLATARKHAVQGLHGLLGPSADGLAIRLERARGLDAFREALAQACDTASRVRRTEAERLRNEVLALLES